MLLHVCDKQKNNKYYANWFQINIFAVAKTIQFEAIQNKNYSVVKTLGCPRPLSGAFLLPLSHPIQKDRPTCDRSFCVYSIKFP